MGETLSTREQDDALALGVYAADNEMALWAAFGSRAEMLNAPATLVYRTRLSLMGRAEGERLAARKAQDDAERARTGGGMAGHQKVTSSYSPSPRR